MAVLSSGNNIINKPTLSAINASATATAAQVVSGYFTSTSAAATTITLPTASAIATQISGSNGSIAQGTSLYFTVDNSTGANTVTVAVNTGVIIVPTVVVTGSNVLTVAKSSVGIFKLVFTSSTTAILFRVD